MAKKKESEDIKLLTQDVNLDKIKNELTDYIDQKIQKIVDDKVKKETISEIDKANKRLIREKNRKIFYKNIIIIILIAACAGLTYLLYDNGYFDKYFNKNKEETEKKSNNKKTTNTKTPKEENKPTLEDLIDEYGYLLDNIYISDNSDYLEEYYNGNLTTELKNYLALNLIDTSKLQEEDDYNIIDTDDIKGNYEKLFDTKYESKTFKYNGNIIRYINKIDSYITESKVEKTSSNIKRVIKEIKVEDKKIKISTVEFKENDNKKYNILTNEATNEDDKLNKITYTFKDGKLIGIDS